MTKKKKKIQEVPEQFVAHILAQTSPNCPKCNSTPCNHEVRNYDLMWHDGDVHCKKCGAYVRTYDAG